VRDASLSPRLAAVRDDDGAGDERGTDLAWNCALRIIVCPPILSCLGAPRMQCLN
jgi:hypothetical protein